MMGFFDSPQISQMAFNARRCASGSSLVAGAVDGTVRVGEGRATRIGYRLFPQPTARASSVPVLLLIKFHGNSELAADYDRGICPMRQMLRSSAFRLALLVVDFRGFGWSDGSPALTKLPGDACDVMDALFATELPKHGLSDAVVVVHGRSIGSVCAARVASSPHSARLAGMIIESGLNVITELPMVKQLVKMMPKIAYVVPLLPDPFQQCKQMRAMPETLPLLVLHGEADQVCPAAHGQQLYDAAASRRKIIKRWGSGPRGHNDLGTHPAYHPLVLNFLERCVALAAALAKVGGAARGAAAERHAALPSAAEIGAMRAKELKARLSVLGVDASRCVEKSDFVALLGATYASATAPTGGGAAAVAEVDSGWALSAPSVQLAPALSGGAFFATCAAVGVGFALLARSLLFVETRGAVALAAAFIIIGTLAAGL
jgi:pimeloyl-ACP methyl ester carboxylesterase